MDKTSNLPAPAQKLSKKKKSKLTPEVSNAGPSENHVEMSEQTSFIKKKSFWKSLFRFRSRKHEVPETVVDLRTPAVKIPNLDTIFEENDHQKPEDPSRKLKETQDSQSQSQDLTDTSSTSDSTSEEQEDADQEEQPQKKIKEVNNPLTRIKIHELLQQIDETIQEFEAPSADAVTNKPPEQTIQKAPSGGLIKDDYSFEYSSDSASELEEDSKDTHEEEASESKVTSSSTDEVGEVVKKNVDSPKSSSLTDHIEEVDKADKEKLNVELLLDSKTEVDLGLVKEDEPDKGERRVTFVSPPIDQPVDILPQTSQSDTTEEEEHVLKDQGTSFILVDETDLDQYNQLHVSNHDLTQVPFPMPTILEEVYESATVQDSAPSIQSEQRHIEELDLSPYHQPNTHKWVEDPEDINWIEEQLRKKIEEKEKFRNFDTQSSPGTDKTESRSWSFDENPWKCPEVQPTQEVEPKWVDIDVILQRLEDNESLNRNENQLKQASSNDESLTDFDTWGHSSLGKTFAPQGFAVSPGYDCIMDKTGLVGLRPKLEQIYRSEEEIEPDDPDFDDNENRLSTSSDGPSLPYSRHHQTSEQDEVRLDNSYKMVFHNNAIDYTVIYDPLPNERPETSTGSKPKFQKKRKILSLSHDRNFDTSIDNQISFNSPDLNDAPSPKSTSVLVASLEEPGINSVLENTRKKLMQIISSINPDERETSLYPNNFQDRININLNEDQSTSEPSIDSTKDDLEAACTSLNNTTSRIKFRQESIETYDKVGQNVENMINDLLINVKDLKDDCVRAGVPDVDQPSTSENVRLRDISSRLSLVMARDILNDILEITYDKVDERGDCVWVDDSEPDMNDYFISQPFTNLQEQVHHFFDDYQMPFGPEILELNLISEDLSKTVEGLKKLDNFGDLSLRSKLPQNEKEPSSRSEDFIDLDIPLVSNSPLNSDSSFQTDLDPLSFPQTLVLQETMQDFLSSKVNENLNLTQLEDKVLEAHPQIDKEVTKLSSGNVDLSLAKLLTPEITVFEREEASRLEKLAVDTEILQDTPETRKKPISKFEGNEIPVGISLGNVNSVSVATEVKEAHEGNIDLSLRIPTEKTSPQEAIEAKTNLGIDKIDVEASSSKVESINEKSNTTLEVSKTTTKNHPVNQSEASGVFSSEAPVPPNDQPSAACEASSITFPNLQPNQIEIPGNSGNEPPPPTDEDPQNPLSSNPAEDQPTTISIETFPSNHPLYTNCTLKEGLQKTAGFLSTIYSELCEYNPVSYLMKQTANLRVIPEPEIHSPGGRSDDQMVEAAGLARFEEIMAELGGVREEDGRRYSDLDCRVRGEADMMIFHRRYSELDTRAWVECPDSLFVQERDEEVERKDLLTEPGCSRQMDDLIRRGNKGLGKAAMDEGPKHVYVVDDLFNSLETGLLDEASGYSGPSHTGKYMEDSVESARLDEASGYSSSYYTSLDPCLPNIDSDVNLVNFGSEISPDITPSTSWTQKTVRSKAFHYDEGQNDEKQFHFVPVDETELTQSFFHDFHLDGSNSSDLRLIQPETPRQIYLPNDHRLDTISEDSKLEELSLYATINTATSIIENIENIIYPSNLDEVQHTSCQNPPKYVTKNYFSATGTPGRLEYIDPNSNNSPGESSTVSTPLDSQHLELERKLPDLNLPLSKKELNDQIEESLKSFEESINEMVDINRKTLEMLNSKQIATPVGSISIISENISDPRINPNPQDTSKTKLDHEKNGKSSIKSLIRTDPDHLQADPVPETSSSSSNDILLKHHEYLRAQKLKDFVKKYEKFNLRLETKPQVPKPDPKSINIRVDPRFNFGIRKSKIFSDEVEHKAKVHFGEKQM